MHVVPSGLTHLFLILNVLAMTTSSLLIIIRRYSEYAVGGLIAVVVTQALGYGLIFDLNFFLRNLSVMGGLLMVLSDSWVRKKFAPAGLPQLDEKDRKMYFQLAGRVLLIFLFIGFVFAGDWSLGRVVVIVVGAVACVMVAVGFKAKWSAIILVMILSIFNILVNNFWTVSSVLSHLTSWRRFVLTGLIYSYTPTTRTRTLRSTTSSRSSPSWVVCCCWSTWDRARSASMRRRRCTDEKVWVGKGINIKCKALRCGVLESWDSSGFKPFGGSGKCGPYLLEKKSRNEKRLRARVFQLSLVSGLVSFSDLHCPSRQERWSLAPFNTLLGCCVVAH